MIKVAIMGFGTIGSGVVVRGVIKLHPVGEIAHAVGHRAFVAGHHLVDDHGKHLAGGIIPLFEGEHI